jgi:tetratricopeptide (TPR) repeat protein
MPVITRGQAVAECDALVDRAVAARLARDRDAEVEALRACLAHPCAPHELFVPELWEQLADAYRTQRRFDEAIEAWEQAIVAGYRSVPHPRANVADILLAAGRRAEADALFEALRQECAGDIWLYNAAGWAYSDAGDDEEALRWLEAGIELALATGDTENLLGQLVELRERSLESLGRDVDDDLARRAGVHERQPGRHRPLTEDFGGVEPELGRCDHCGWDPDEERATRMPITEAEAFAAALRSTGPRPSRPPPAAREKIGRNEPCPCGSGSKYKHCHGR